LNIYQTQP